MSRLNFYIGVFLTSSCMLMLQLIQTRILSVVAWYHLAFFAISMAMFGLTAGAVWVYLRRERFTEKTLSYDLSYFNAAFAVTTALCLPLQMTLVPVISRAVTSIWTWAELAVVVSAPFIFAGIVISLALTRSPLPIGRVYGVDLVGAAVGCLGVLLILNNTDGPSAVLWVAAIAATGALAFSRSSIGSAPDKKPILASLLRHPMIILLVLVASAFINGLTDYGLQPQVVKGRFEGGGSHIFREWNSFSRIAVFAGRNLAPALWGQSPTMPDDWSLEQRFMNIDGDAGSIAYHFTGDLNEAEFLKYDITNLAYFLADRERVGIIGVGGGRDMLSAAVFGSEDITGVELNPIFIRLLTEEPGFAEFTNLTSLAGAQFVADEGRSWFARSEDDFDIIQMSLTDTWAATGAGAFTLSENGLYTVEAWKTFLGRLSPTGVLSVSRWYNPEQVNETGRLLSLAVAALLELGASEPQRHIFLASQGRIATLVLSRSPFSPADLEALERAVNQYKHEVLLSPAVLPASETLFKIVTVTGRKDLDRFTSSLDFDLTPPTDDRPFFFNQLRFSRPVQALSFAIHMVGGDAEKGGVREGNLVATATLMILFLVSLGLVLATIVIPLRPAVRDVGGKLAAGGTLYFMLIGIGFMMVEISLLQRMSVYLGHPIYSLSVLLFTLILATGIGSFLSDRLQLDSRIKFAAWALLVSGYIIALPLWLPDVFLAFDSATLLVRAALCVVTIAPAGLLMGFGFPTGMRLISSIDRRPTPWFWGINGAAGVLASIVAVVSSIAFGISVTLTIGAICYLLLIPTTFSFIWSREAASAGQAALGET